MLRTWTRWLRVVGQVVEEVVTKKHHYPNCVALPPEAAKCGVKVRRHREFTLVTVREVADNPGQGVAAFASHLATRVCQRYDLDPMRLVWVEEGLPGRLSLRSGQGQVRVLRHFTFDLEAGHFGEVVGWVGIDEEEYRRLWAGEWEYAGGLSPRAVQGVVGEPVDLSDIGGRLECGVCGAGGLVIPACELPEHWPLRGWEVLPGTGCGWDVVRTVETEGSCN